MTTQWAIGAIGWGLLSGLLTLVGLYVILFAMRKQRENRMFMDILGIKPTRSERILRVAVGNIGYLLMVFLLVEILQAVVGIVVLLINLF